MHDLVGWLMLLAAPKYGHLLYCFVLCKMKQGTLRLSMCCCAAHELAAGWRCSSRMPNARLSPQICQLSVPEGYGVSLGPRRHLWFVQVALCHAAGQIAITLITRRTVCSTACQSWWLGRMWLMSPKDSERCLLVCVVCASNFAGGHPNPHCLGTEAWPLPRPGNSQKIQSSHCSVYSWMYKANTPEEEQSMRGGIYGRGMSYCCMLKVRHWQATRRNDGCCC